jgi:hypothetical protein
LLNPENIPAKTDEIWFPQSRLVLKAKNQVKNQHRATHSSFKDASSPNASTGISLILLPQSLLI